MDTEFELPFVSVCMITYNHAKYITDAIEGVLMQEINFPIELIIANDASTDNSNVIINELIKNHSKGSLIKYFNHKSNMGMMPNFIFALEQCKGKYTAICEGDDFWKDPYKLQKQVDFLEANPDFTICFHNSEEKFEDNSKPSHLYCSSEQKEVSELEDLLRNLNFIPTCSVVFKSGHLKKFPDWFIKLGMGDWILHILNAQYGKIKFINEVMGVHRIHSGGVWSGGDSVKNNIYIYQTYRVLANYFKQNDNLLKIINQNSAIFLHRIYSEFLLLKNKKEALKYFSKLFYLNPFCIFKLVHLKNVIKIIVTIQAEKNLLHSK